MATTTNYSWTTPDDTDLVKDGAAAIRTLGTAIDSTVFTNAGAAVAKATVDAKGDLIAGTADNTVARLAVGTNGQLLSADSTAATGLAWTAAPTSGGMTLISTTTLSGVTTTLSSIPQTYNILYLIVEGVTGNTGNASIRIKPNNSTSNNYVALRSTITTTSGESTAIGLTVGRNSLRTDANNAWAVFIDNYTSTTRYKPFSFYGFFNETGPAPTQVAGFGAYQAATEVTSLVLDFGGTNTFAGGTVKLYGVK